MKKNTNDYIITIPDRVTNENIGLKINEIEEALQGCDSSKRAIFDFSSATNLCPTAIVYIAMCRDILNNYGVKTFARRSNNALLNYLVTDFGLINLNDKEDSLFKQYMVELKRCMNIDECSLCHKEIISMIHKADIDKGTLSAIDYILNEVWDNAGVHGYKCYREKEYPLPVYMALYSYRDRIEIAIGDIGQGIHKSLSGNNINYKKKSAKEAILDSIDNGVSGHPTGSPGFGLFSTNTFTNAGSGKLGIWSSGYFLEAYKDKKYIKRSNFRKGTIVSIVIYKNSKIPFTDTMKTWSSVDDYIETMMGDVFL